VLPQHPEPRGDAAKDDAFNVAEIAASTRRLQFVIQILLALAPMLILKLVLSAADCFMARQRLLASYNEALFVLSQTDQGFVVVEILTVFIEGVVVFEARDRRLLESQLDLCDVHFLLLS